MNSALTDENIATRKGSTAIEIALLFPSLSPSKLCTTNFLDSLATSIVSSVGKTDKNLLRLYCSPNNSQVKVQVLNTYVPVKNLRSNTDVALELQRQLSFAGSPLRSNVTTIDPSFRPSPITVTNCADDSVRFEPFCPSSTDSSSKSITTSSSVLRGEDGEGESWLGLQAHSSSTILIFVAVGVLACLLLAVFSLCVRRLWKNKRRVEDKTKWMEAVQKEQAQELAGTKGASTEEISKTCSEHRLLLTTIAIPELPPSTHATPSPSPRSVPPLLQDLDSNIYQDYENNPKTSNNEDDDEYMQTPPSEHAYMSEEPDAFHLNEDLRDDVLVNVHHAILDVDRTSCEDTDQNLLLDS